MTNIRQDVDKLQEEVARLTEKLGEVEDAQAAFWKRIRNMLRKYRAAILRLEIGDSGEKWHAGFEYTRGTRLRVPKLMPLVLREWSEYYESKISRFVRTDSLAGDKEIVSGVRNGIPPVV